MKLRVGNGCWHAGHIEVAAYCQEAGLFTQEGIDVEVVTAKIYTEGLESSRPDGERYDEVGTVVRDMIAFGIDIIPDVHVRTPFAERALGNDELRIIGGWRNQFPAALVTAAGIKSIRDLKGKRIGDWYRGGIATLWLERQMRLAQRRPRVLARSPSPAFWKTPCWRLAIARRHDGDCSRRRVRGAAST